MVAVKLINYRPLNYNNAYDYKDDGKGHGEDKDCKVNKDDVW